MMNKINFITGENYTLSELFSDEGKIIIPDLQRDYCWGDEVHTKNKIELVSDFTTNLIQSFEQEQRNKLNLGLIYGYESLESHIQLCDGQQRITTLYLLIGMLNKKVEGNPFRKLLISDYEYLEDDKEPYLQYSIRESSLYFLSDLVCHFFIEEADDKENVKYVENIKSAQWFFNDYKDDASIQSMLRALKKMETILGDKTAEWCCEFGKFLMTQLTFMYYDMGNRKNGEETFVVINTTGEPLTATQNLKPLVIHADINKGYARTDADGHTSTIAIDWEEIETWFWKNRGNGNNTAEAGFDEFLRWVTMSYADKETLQRVLKQKTAHFPYEKIAFEKVYECWKVTQFLFNEWGNTIYPRKDFLSPKESEKAISQLDCFQLLPLMTYCLQWNVTEAKDRNLLRWYHFLHNIARKSDVGKAVNGLVYDAIEMVKSYQDVLELIENKKCLKISETILTDEERLKLTILKENISDREAIEEAFWKAQNRDEIKSHHIWAGEIKPLIDWATAENGFHLDAFNGYLNMVDRLFEGNCEDNIDLVRRALLTRSLPNYPIKQGNGFNFGWGWADWHQLIRENSEAFGKFFDDCIKNAETDLEAYLKSLCDEFPLEQDWAEFVHCPYLLEYCNTKHTICNDGINHILVKNSWSKPFAVKNAHLLYSLGATWQNGNILFDEKYPQWRVWYYQGQIGNCVVIENTERKIAIDVVCSVTECTITLFRRRTDKENIRKYFSSICSTPEWEWNGERWEKMIDYKLDNGKVRDVLDELIGRIEQMD